MMQTFYTSPLFIIIAGMVFIMLMGLTMRSVIRRDKAMIDTHMDEPQRVEAYKSRWRNAA